MAHGRDTHQKLRALYVTDRQPLKAAASMLKVSYSAAIAWKKAAKMAGDDWDAARLAARLTDTGPQALVHVLLEEFAPLLQSTMEEVKVAKLAAADKVECLSRLSDAMHKTAKLAGLVHPDVAKLSIGLEFMRKLAQFTAEHFPQHQQVVLDILEPFGETLAQESAA